MSSRGSAAPPASVDELEERLSRPDERVARDLAHLDGDLLVLGAGGKMGPTLARMAQRALRQNGSPHTVIAVSRFAEPAARGTLEAAGVRTIACDLLAREALVDLPDAAAVVFMAGAKFGTAAAPARTWMLNAVLPGRVSERYAGVPTVVFSSGNVYPLVATDGAGASETTPVAPLGEYAWSVCARERVFAFGAEQHGTPTVLLRLNYAVDLRYGVLVDIAQDVAAGRPIDLTMGHVNVIWQGDANAFALRALRHVGVPPLVLNVAGGERLAVRALAERFGALLGRRPHFTGREAPTALLSDASRAAALFGPPRVDSARLVEWVAHWLRHGGPTLGRPTHFEVRDGGF